MAENLDVLNSAVSLFIRAVLLAARFSGRVRKRSLRRLAARDTDAKAKEILFLKGPSLPAQNAAIDPSETPP